MNCSKCGKENPDDAKHCNSCGSVLTSTLEQGPTVVVKRSRMAIAAFVFSILSLFTFGISAPLAIVLGIISLVIIEKSGGRITGRGFAISGIVIPVLGLLILLPALNRVRQKAFRMICETNMAHIGMAMNIYRHDYDDEFPRAGGINSIWHHSIPNWMADNRFEAFGLGADGSGGMATITSSLYLLVKYAEITPSQDEIVVKSGTPIKDVEKELIEKTLDEVKGNRKRAARLLGIGERTLYRRMKEYGLS